MPYGIYTVHQTSGWEGREMMDDFDVFISQDVYKRQVQGRYTDAVDEVLLKVLSAKKKKLKIK